MQRPFEFQPDLVIMFPAHESATRGWVDTLLSEHAEDISQVCTHWDGAFENTGIKLRSKD